MKHENFRLTKKEFKAANKEVKIRLKSLKAAVKKSDKDPVLLKIVSEYTETLEALNKPVEFLYNFESGGWNSQNALHIDEALKLANARWAGSKTLKIKKDSFRISSSDEVTNLLNTFN